MHQSVQQRGARTAGHCLHYSFYTLFMYSACMSSSTHVHTVLHVNDVCGSHNKIYIFFLLFFFLFLFLSVGKKL